MAFLVTVNDDLIEVKKLKGGKWKFSKIQKKADFTDFKELEKYIKQLDKNKK
jgi:hypothetical protein